MVVNLLGNGFVGSHFVKYGNLNYLVNNKNDFTIKKSNQVFYLISTVDNYTMRENPYIDIETNLSLLIKTLENLRYNRYKGIFNFASSWFVYGDTDIPANEHSICRPKGFYSITKRTAEQLLINYCETYNIKYRILRFANVIGINDSKASNKKNAFSYIIDKIKTNNQIELYNDGFFTRDYIDARDLVKAVEIVISKGEINTIYNIGNNIWHQFRNIIQYIIQKTNSDSQIFKYPSDNFIDSIHINYFCMDSSKLSSLGYEPSYSMDETLDHMIK